MKKLDRLFGSTRSGSLMITVVAAGVSDLKAVGSPVRGIVTDANSNYDNHAK